MWAIFLGLGLWRSKRCAPTLKNILRAQARPPAIKQNPSRTGTILYSAGRCMLGTARRLPHPACHARRRACVDNAGAHYEPQDGYP